MDKKLETLYDLCEQVSRKLEECQRNLAGTDTMSVQDIEIVDKLAHALKCLKTTIAMTETEEDDGNSRRSMAYAYDGGSYGRRSYDGGSSGRRGRSPSTGRYVSRDGGYSSHDGIEDIMDDIRDMPESERRKIKQMLERM